MPEGTAYGVQISSPPALSLGVPLGSLSLPGLVRLELTEDISLTAPLSQLVDLPLSHREGVTLSCSEPFRMAGEGASWRLSVTGVADFGWASAGDVIHVHPAPGADSKLVPFWVLHLVVPLMLSLGGRGHVLHAAGARIDGVSWLFLAEGHGGKSTLAAHCASAGDALLGDDKVVLTAENGAMHLWPAHPFVRPGREREVLGERVDTFDPDPRAVGGLVFLEPVSASAEPSLEALEPRKVFARLQPQYLFGLPTQTTERFHFLGDLARDVPGYRLQVPWDRQRLPAVRAVLQAASSKSSASGQQRPVQA